MECDKIKHDTEELALRRLMRLFGYGGERVSEQGKVLHAYHCEQCNAWHVGHWRMGKRYRKWLDDVAVMLKHHPWERAVLICLHLFREMQRERLNKA